MDLRQLVLPYSLRTLKRKVSRTDEVRILDIGCGPDMPGIAARAFPRRVYHGIDIAKPNPETLRHIDEFFPLDLTSSDFAEIKDGFYDAILMSHVIEHIMNGEKVIAALAPKLKPQGAMFVEFPSVRSLGLPSGTGTLQFCDDDTHVRVYEISEVANAMLRAGLTVVKAGTRRDWVRFALAPAAIPLQIRTLIATGHLHARGLWDILGFASFVLAIRKIDDGQTMERINPIEPNI
jgi:predicted TPR repeat methyltransferase